MSELLTYVPELVGQTVNVYAWRHSWKGPVVLDEVAYPDDALICIGRISQVTYNHSTWWRVIVEMGQGNRAAAYDMTTSYHTTQTWGGNCQAWDGCYRSDFRQALGRVAAHHRMACLAPLLPTHLLRYLGEAY